jgi:hypothetical protein
MNQNGSLTRVVQLAICLALLGIGAIGHAKEAEPNFVEQMLARIEMGEPVQGKVAILIPLILTGDVEAPEVDSQFTSSTLMFTEPEFPSHRYAARVTNAAERPVLVLAGTVLVGGERDRLLRHDCLVGPGRTVEMRALPASTTAEIRRDPIPFVMGHELAPVYLRRKGDYGGSAGFVTAFIARNLEFRNEGVKEKSLAAIGRSTLLNEYTAQARAKLKDLLGKSTQRGLIVGAMTAIRGRVQSVMLFGSPKLLQASGDAYLKGATYAAAAVALQAEKLNVPIPGKDDPEATLAIVRKDAEKLMQRLRKAKLKTDRTQPEGAVGERVMLQLAAGARGRAVGLNGQLVHLEVYPHDPFESALYGSKVELPEEDVESDPDRVGLAELGRKAKQGRRLSEQEKRLLRGVGRARVGGGVRKR